jgi:hypothetical protein
MAYFSFVGYVPYGRRPSSQLLWLSKLSGEPMLWTIFVILLVLWFLGLVSSYTLGGFIHLLLLLALAVLVIRLIEGQRPLV